jgi:hypothetical protein
MPRRGTAAPPRLPTAALRGCLLDWACPAPPQVSPTLGLCAWGPPASRLVGYTLLPLGALVPLHGLCASMACATSRSRSGRDAAQLHGVLLLAPARAAGIERHGTQPSAMPQCAAGCRGVGWAPTRGRSPPPPPSRGRRRHLRAAAGLCARPRHRPAPGPAGGPTAAACSGRALGIGHVTGRRRGGRRRACIGGAGAEARDTAGIPDPAAAAATGAPRKVSWAQLPCLQNGALCALVHRGILRKHLTQRTRHDVMTALPSRVRVQATCGARRGLPHVAPRRLVRPVCPTPLASPTTSRHPSCPAGARRLCWARSRLRRCGSSCSRRVAAGAAAAGSDCHARVGAVFERERERENPRVSGDRAC